MRLPLAIALAAALAACSGESPAQKPAADLHAAVRRLTTRDGVATQMTQRPDGMRVFHVTQGLGQVVVAKSNGDGTVSAKCVESADDAFLPAEGSEK